MDFISTLRPVVAEFAERYNLIVYDITFRRERNGRVLRISLDGASVSLENCAAVSRLTSAWLDEREELIPYDNYTLEVSSPGGERPLRNEAEFAMHKGKLCRITTKSKDSAGRARYKGRIMDVKDGSVKIYTEEESAEFVIEIAEIKKANLELEI